MSRGSVGVGDALAKSDELSTRPKRAAFIPLEQGPHVFIITPSHSTKRHSWPEEKSKGAMIAIGGINP